MKSDSKDIENIFNSLSSDAIAGQSRVMTIHREPPSVIVSNPPKSIWSYCCAGSQRENTTTSARYTGSEKIVFSSYAPIAR